MEELQTWVQIIYSAIPNTNSPSQFGKLIIKSVVSDSAKTVALGIPQGAFQTFYIIFGCWLATKLPNARCYVMMASNIPTIIGACILWKLPRTYEVGCLFGYYIVSIPLSTIYISALDSKHTYRSGLSSLASFLQCKCQPLTSVATPSV
jgi:hypothetical protein